MKRIAIRAFLATTCVAVIGVAHAQDEIRYHVIAPGGRTSDGAHQAYGSAGQGLIGVGTGTAGDVNAGYIYVMRDYFLSDFVTVLITGFDATVRDNGVVLTWRIGDANQLLGFNVYRSDDVDVLFERINDVLLPASDGFSFRDESIEPATTYVYRLGAVDSDGEVLSATVTVNTPVWQTELRQNYPNPFNPTTTIDFYLAAAAKTSLKIFDVGGHLVKTLVDQSLPYGRHTVTWDGRNNAGQGVSSGVYLYRLVAGNKVFTRKLMILK